MDALKLGLDYSEAEYVALMNSDDLCSSDRFHKQLAALEKTNSDLSVTDITKFRITKKGRRKIIGSLLGHPPGNFNNALLLLGSYRADATWCFRREWARKNNLFRLKGDVSDWTVGMRVIPKTKLHVIAENLYFYRMHGGQVTRKSDYVAQAGFYSRWINLNTDLNLPILNQNEIQAIALPWEHAKKLNEITNLKNWLNKIEKQLLLGVTSRENHAIRALLARRKLVLTFKQRALFLQFTDMQFIPLIFFEYIQFRKYARGKLN
jgi:hypothetical protein